MRDYIYLSSAPVDEPCVQVSRDKDYYPAMQQEVAIFKRQLERQFNLNDRDESVYLKVKHESHDFGGYLEVVAVYDDQDEAAVELAFEMEGNLPEKWDDIAREELKQIPEYEKYVK